MNSQVLKSRFINIDQNTYQLISEQIPSCFICLKLFDSNDVLFTNCCGKLYHKHCINKWTYDIRKTQVSQEHCPSCNSSFD